MTEAECPGGGTHIADKKAHPDDDLSQRVNRHHRRSPRTHLNRTYPQATRISNQHTGAGRGAGYSPVYHGAREVEPRRVRRDERRDLARGVLQARASREAQRLAEYK